MGRQNMMQQRRFSMGGQKPAPEPHHYRISGLDDIYLINGFTREMTSDGEVVKIADVEGLHKAIGHRILTESRPLTPREFRFLRKNMDLTQEDLAKRLKVDVQTVARYEKDQTAIPWPTDMLLRIMFALHIVPPDRRAEFVDEIRAIIKYENSKQEDGKGVLATKWRELAVHH